MPGAEQLLPFASTHFVPGILSVVVQARAVYEGLTFGMAEVAKRAFSTFTTLIEAAEFLVQPGNTYRLKMSRMMWMETFFII
jgi:hypothetical protein